MLDRNLDVSVWTIRQSSLADRKNTGMDSKRQGPRQASSLLSSRNPDPVFPDACIHVFDLNDHIWIPENFRRQPES